MESSYRVSFWLRKVLVPVDGSENGFRALELAVDFAKRYGSKITVVHVKGEGTDEVRKSVQSKLERKVDYEFKLLEAGTDSSVPNEILKELYDGSYDAVILGARGTSINQELNIGSTALAIAANSPTTVIIVR
ncbi:universal stress protein A [Sulfodiicoccus acidiphilus]|uniref:Universal stress protein A n=1 Tax=Sulfodiicoccus acidiphilus TaxID=1670455 RepID=A0A348B357_9CREN|nr:universal stress protein [Sulfodiicoccus acidiphilus]BBD72609.1 universal stress protein A [Sulfodiicoccus acidiphilus]GGT93358.1 universal stress protein A [Sulfodiicoccus acidiphilus]